MEVWPDFLFLLAGVTYFTGPSSDLLFVHGEVASDSKPEIFSLVGDG
jgi:hypothetical protein